MLTTQLHASLTRSFSSVSSPSLASAGCDRNPQLTVSPENVSSAKTLQALFAKHNRGMPRAGQRLNVQSVGFPVNVVEMAWDREMVSFCLKTFPILLVIFFIILFPPSF